MFIRVFNTISGRVDAGRQNFRSMSSAEYNNNLVKQSVYLYRSAADRSVRDRTKKLAGAFVTRSADTVSDS